MSFGWEPGNDKQNYVVCIFVSNDNGKITRKVLKCLKCCCTVDFEETNTECSTGKNFGFWVLRGIFNEYIKQNIIRAVLTLSRRRPISYRNQDWFLYIGLRRERVKKRKFSFSCHLQIDKKTNNVPRRKTDSNFIFSQPT